MWVTWNEESMLKMSVCHHKLPSTPHCATGVSSKSIKYCPVVWVTYKQCQLLNNNSNCCRSVQRLVSYCDWHVVKRSLTSAKGDVENTLVSYVCQLIKGDIQIGWICKHCINSSLCMLIAVIKDRASNCMVIRRSIIAVESLQKVNHLRIHKETEWVSCAKDCKASNLRQCFLWRCAIKFT